jgi:hypothetical protein
MRAEVVMDGVVAAGELLFLVGCEEEGDDEEKEE